ncbi:hypothetical protein CRG98_001321 [Punica granatum]|uniref:Uncharacterized protein n=1 Tax=Punica granatum TaxID=22663 RepID=A0A2I0LC57_PUNGR|nr:hypothetical protein CRG98_001321 [Punica granatum]
MKEEVEADPPRIGGELGGGDHVRLAHVHHVLVEPKAKPGGDLVWPDHNLSWMGLVRLLMGLKEPGILSSENETLGDGLHELIFRDQVDLKDFPTSALGRGGPRSIGVGGGVICGPRRIVSGHLGW